MGNNRIKTRIKILKKKAMLNSFLFSYGRGSRIRTHTGGFGDRCATIDTIPLSDFIIIQVLFWFCNIFFIKNPKIIAMQSIYNLIVFLVFYCVIKI